MYFHHFHLLFIFPLFEPFNCSFPSSKTLCVYCQLFFFFLFFGDKTTNADAGSACSVSLPLYAFFF
ncbi:hypothetical protein GLYMA_12G202450v4 [Glycine max]|nr:hypothetical protein GLYMA_12G202450v4 [Glycine max]KAH1144116.1 hypothetical protein GYH30_034365 [Glycine max]